MRRQFLYAIFPEWKKSVVYDETLNDINEKNSVAGRNKVPMVYIAKITPRAGLRDEVNINGKKPGK